MWILNHSFHQYPSEFRNVDTFNIQGKKALIAEVEKKMDPVTANPFTLF